MYICLGLEILVQLSIVPSKHLLLLYEHAKKKYSV